MKRIAVLTVVGLLAAACGDTASPNAAPQTSPPVDQSSTAAPTISAAPSTTAASGTSSSTTASSSVAALPSECQGLGVAPATSRLTFTSANHVYEVDADGVISCLVEHSSGEPDQFVWGADADKVLFSDGHVITAGSGRGPVAGIVSAGFSRPTGTSAIWIQGGLLKKASVDGGVARVLDVETLEFGTELSMERAAYHPDGKHILVSFHAPNEDTSWIYVTDNEGAEPAVLVTDEGAAVLDLQPSSDGTKVFFVVSHTEGHSDLHLLDMAAAIEEFEDGDGVVTKFLQPSDQNQIETLLTGSEPIHNLVMAPDGQSVLAAQGECASGSTSYFSDLSGDPQPLLSGQSTVPVGFLDEQRVALLLLDPKCDGSGDLVTLDLQDGGVELVQGNVDGAAVRSLLPAAQMSLSDVVITGFA